MQGTEWLRAMARGPLQRPEAIRTGKDDDGKLRPRDVPPPNPGHVFAKATARLMTDPYTRIERTGGYPKRARGSNRLPTEGSGADTGAVPWYVPEDAVFDTEMGQGWVGYHSIGGFNLGVGPWRHVGRDELSLDEIEDLTAVYHDEIEDWAEYDHAPVRPTIRAGGWVDQDWTGHWEAEVDEWVDHLIEYSGWAFTGDEPNYDRIQLLWAEFNKGRVPEAAVWERDRVQLEEERRERLLAEQRDRLQRAAEVRYQLRTGSGPAPTRKAAKEASPTAEDWVRAAATNVVAPAAGRNDGPPARTAGLPTDDDGRIDPDAWKQLWA